jgi:hypothetical protein
MKKIFLAGIAAALLSAAAANADVAEFYGNWENVARDATGILHVVVSPAGGNRASIRVYGDCHPSECDWGVVPAESLVDKPGSTAVRSLSAVIHYGFAHRRITLRKAGGGQLSFVAQVRFVEGTGKKDFTHSGRLKPTDWPGPTSKASWERPLSRSVGWGGGARGAQLAKPSEVCTVFDPATLQLLPAGRGWNIMAGKAFVLHTDWKEKDARGALAVIRHYHFDRKCHTGTMEFWKTGGIMPADKTPNPGCIQFNSTTAHVIQIGKNWRVVDGAAMIADMNVSRDNAYAVLAMVRQYRLERKCAVAWPNPVMTYWLRSDD